MDLTVPGGGISSLTGTCGTDEGTEDVSDLGSINRILGEKRRRRIDMMAPVRVSDSPTCGINYSET